MQLYNQFIVAGSPMIVRKPFPMSSICMIPSLHLDCAFEVYFPNNIKRAANFIHFLKGTLVTLMPFVKKSMFFFLRDLKHQLYNILNSHMHLGYLSISDHRPEFYFL